MFGAFYQRVLLHRGGALRTVAIAFWLVTLALFSGKVLAEPAKISTHQALDRWASFNVSQQADFIEQLIVQGHLDLADAQIAKTRFGAEGQDRRLFIQGRLLRARGRTAEAIGVYRDLLAQRPNYDRVRLELAQTLAQHGEDESARHHFELLLGANASSREVDQTVRAFIDTLDGRRRWNATAYVTVAPSTNVNQGTNQDVVMLNGLPFAINAGARRTSGVGLVAGAQAGYQLPLATSLDLVFAGGGQTKVYRDSSFNDAIINASVGPRWRFNNGSVGVYATSDYRWIAGDVYGKGIGGLVSGYLRLSQRDAVHGSVACSRRLFDTAWAGSDLSYQDGHVCSVDGRIEHAMTSTTSVRVLGGVGQERTGRVHLNNNHWYAGAGVFSELPLGVSMYFEGKYTRRDYEGIFPAMGVGRLDGRWDLAVNLTKRDLNIFGFAPMLQYTFTHNVSNVGLYDFDAHSVNVTLTKKF